MKKPKYIQIEIKEAPYEVHLIGESTNFIFNPNTRNGEELSDFLSGCEEIPDPTAQLKADKAELLDFMKELKDRFEYYNDKVSMFQIETLIQKHKQ